MIIVFLISLIACSMNPETAVTFTRGHFNKVVFAVFQPAYSKRKCSQVVLKSSLRSIAPTCARNIVEPHSNGRTPLEPKL